MSVKYHYEAFISYRHLPLDAMVADYVQKLLEQYRPPRNKSITPGKRIRPIFRDKTELPTSGDLGASLTEALLSSRYLIVVLSEETKNSKWCMEEIRRFKEAHGGSISHILPILVSGEPQDSIPDILRYEERETPGGERIRIEVEPLCCDVRAKNRAGVKRQTRTEFLRLAATILGCRYDDLFQRSLRRKNRIKLGVLAVLSVILGIISFFGVKAYIAEQRYEKNLVDTYTRQGAEQLLQNNVQKALMYYADALQLDPADQAAKTGALLLLQQNNWLSLTRETDGRLISGRPFSGYAYAQATNADGSRILFSTVNDCYLAQADGTIITRLTEYGDFIQSAEDGSCWSFANEEWITFYFTEDARIWQVPRPTKINPACDPDTVELFQSALPPAMAITPQRAMVRWGGYLYLYDLKDDGTAELFTEFDLAGVFTDSGRRNNLDTYNMFWMDDGGLLAVVADGSCAAVFNVRSVSTPHLLYIAENQMHGLNDVAFSDDGIHFAMIYGNDQGINGLDPGGCFEIYTYEGTSVSVSEFDLGLPLSGAEFEPNSNRLLLWSSSFLQLWDCVSGTAVSVPLYLSDITGAAWAEDGSILVDTGSGKLHIYTPVSFTAAHSTEFFHPDAAAFDKTSRTAVLSDGTVLRRTHRDISMEDAQGTELAYTNLDELSTSLNINHMYVDDASFSFFWDRGKANLCRAYIDQKNVCFSDVNLLNTNGWPVTDVFPVAGGTAVCTGNGYLLYYTYQDVSPRLSLQLSKPGFVQDVAANENGLAAILLRSTTFTGKESGIDEILYSIELWDLNMGVLLGILEDSPARLRSPYFTKEGWLVYQKADDTVARKLDIPNPDSSTIQYIADISCYEMNENQYPEPKLPAFPLSVSGKWSADLQASPVLPAPSGQGSSELSDLLDELDATLKEEGSTAWLERFNRFWADAAASDIPVEELVSLFKDYVHTAMLNDLLDHLRPGFSCIIEKANALTFSDPAEFASAYTVSYTFDILFTHYAQLSTAYDDLLIEYWLASADREEAIIDYDAEDWLQDFMPVYEKRLYASFLRGDGTQSFYSALDSDYHDLLADILYYSNLDTLLYLTKGKPEKAAACINNLMQSAARVYQDIPEELDEWSTDYLSVFGSMVNMLVTRGIISADDMNTCFASLDADTGLHLTQLSAQNIASGLQLGDIVIAVNGVYIVNFWHINELMSRYPTASLTVLRDGSYFTTDPIENWLISGQFINKYHSRIW